MSEWKEVKLGTLCTKVCSGGTPKSGVSDYYGGGIPWLNTKEVNFNRIYSTENTISQNGLDNSSAKWIDANSIIVAMYGATAGKVAITKIPITTNQACCNLTINNELADYNYIYYTLKKDFTILASLANGGAQQNLNTQIIKDYSIRIPDLPTQQRIASILSSLDAKIENNNKINAKLEEIAQNLFKEWFVDFGPFKDGKFVESELGLIPDEWRMGLFSQTVDIMAGGTPKTDIEEYWYNGDIPFFSPKDAGTDVYCTTTEKAITNKGLNACSSRLYPKNTIFITARGTVGKVVMTACDMAMNQSNYAIKPKDSNNNYYTFLVTRSITEKLKHKSNGAVFSAIVTRDFDENIIIPSKDIEEKFNNLVAPLFSKIWNLLQENQRLATLRDTLLPKLMSGEIEV